MKRSFKIVQLVLFFILIVIPVFCLQIEKQFEETSYYLKDICMINSNVGWVVGAPHWDQNEKYYKGTIIKTTDGGESWAEQEAGVCEVLRGVCFVGLNNGWAVGTNGTILHTDNGGDAWIQQTVATTDEFRGVVFTDANNGWATSIEVVHYDWNDEPDDWRGSIWHTSNGGQNWVKQTVPDSTSILNRIDFIDSLNGWAVGIKFIDDSGISPEHAGAFYSTDNGGLTWEEHLSPEPEIVFTGVDMIDDTNTFVVGFKMNSAVDSGSIFRTTDNGESWEQQEPQYTLWDVQFLNPDSGYAIGCMYGAAWGPPILQTLNGGADWELLNIDKHEGEGLYGLAVLDDKVIAVGDHDFLSISDNPWGIDNPGVEYLFSQQYINIHYTLKKIFSIDENHGWAVGERTYKPGLRGQVILYSDNGGATWETQYESAPPLDYLFSVFTLNDVYFADDQNGWAVGNTEWYWDGEDYKHYGAILHTADGGINWEEQGAEIYEGRDREFVAAQFLNSLNGWALAESKFPSDSIYLAHTTNGGNNWEWVNTEIESMFGMGNGDVFFTDSLNGWAVGLKVIHTIDGGNSWQEQSLPYPYDIYAADFTSSQTGWLAGERLYYTTDGGSIWQEKDTREFNDIQFTDSLIGCLVGAGGTVMNTNDGGASWNLQTDEYVTLNTLRGVHFINDSTGWAAGDAGTIVKIINNEAYVEEDNQGTNIPDKVVLLQNYPNPFNSTTKIEYTIHKTAFVEISIYNSLGQLVKTLVKGAQKKGNHYVQWEGKNTSGQFVACGLYYYLLKTQGTTLYRKMLMLK